MCKAFQITVAFAFACLLIFAFESVSLGGEKPEYLASFNPEKGFKPAQRDLTEIFLQVAGSMESYGSPEPYLRHIMKEDSRIRELYRKAGSTSPRSYLAPYMTEEYIDQLCANWKLLSPKIGLEPYAKETGHLMRNAILGTRGKGTMLIEIFNEHQAKVFDSMAGKSRASSDFDTLKAELTTRLELDKTSVDEEKYEVSRRDAVSYAIIIHGTTMKLFKRLDQGLKPADADKVKTVLTSVIMDTGQMAQSELEDGIAEWALGRGASHTTN